MHPNFRKKLYGFLKHINSRFLAGFILSLFLFANTPKRFLHDAVTHHQHTFHNHSKCNTDDAHLTNVGIDCQIDSLVVEAVYGLSIIPVFDFVEITYPSHYDKLCYSFVQTTSERVFLRGPPVC